MSQRSGSWVRDKFCGLLAHFFGSGGGGGSASEVAWEGNVGEVGRGWVRLRRAVGPPLSLLAEVALAGCGVGHLCEALGAEATAVEQFAGLVVLGALREAKLQAFGAAPAVDRVAQGGDERGSTVWAPGDGKSLSNYLLFKHADSE